MKKNATRGLSKWVIGTAALALVALVQPVRAETTTFDTTVNGQVVRNLDGSITVTRNGITTNETTGRTVDTASVENVQKTSTGSEWNRDTVRTNSNGGSATAQTTGSSVNNGNGSGNWSSVTNGSATSGNGKDSTWTTDRNGSWQKTATGGTFQKTADTTFNNGATVDRQTTGTVTKTGTGEDIASTTTGERKGPNGTEKDWTTTRNEQIVNNGNGTKTVDETITRTNSNGQTTTVDKTGEIVKEGNGKWQYDGSKTVTKSPAAATSSATNSATHISALPVASNPASKPSSAAASSVTSGTAKTGFHSRLEEFKTSLESFHRNGRKPEERVALHSQFEELSKHWESTQHTATPEQHRKWGEVKKSWEESGHARK